MDKETFDALQKLTVYVANKGRDEFTIQIDAALQQVWGWMDEVEKDMEDVETLGTDQRAPLTPTE